MDISTIKKDAEEKMQMTLEFLEETFARIRAGRANVRILDGVRVEYYGSHVPLSNVSTVSTGNIKRAYPTPIESSSSSIEIVVPLPKRPKMVC